VTPFPRQERPTFWAEKERAWPEGLAVDPDAELRWPVHEHRSLAWWFHERVRPRREPRLCAYCDGELGVTSPPSIDHFVPVSRDRTLALAWENLYPTCTSCNTSYKRDRWVPEMVRPDVDPVAGWFSLNWRGELSPNGALDASTCRRITRTIEVLGLNAKPRCVARRQVVTLALSLHEALRTGPPARRLSTLKRLMKLLRGGPYRFAVRRVVTDAAEPARP
jgi:uncharacterized protein (TIGR02646 family)